MNASPATESGAEARWRAIQPVSTGFCVPDVELIRCLLFGLRFRSLVGRKDKLNQPLNLFSEIKDI